MFGKNWTPARGTIVERRGTTTGDGAVTNYEFVVDVTTQSGETFRAKVEEPRIATDFKDPTNGMTVDVEYDPKSRKVRFDKDDPAMSWKHYKRSNSDKFDAALSAPAGTPASGAPGGMPIGVSQLQQFMSGQGANAQPSLAQVRQILQAQGIHGGEAGFPHVVQMTPGSPEAAVLRDALLNAFGGVPPEATPGAAPAPNEPDAPTTGTPTP